jgi:iron complex transport system permease protein
LRNLTFWKLGSLGAATWTNVGLLAPLVLIPVCGFPLLSSRLNGFLLGEAEAHALGVPVEATKTLIVILVSVAVGGTVAFTGLIAFVGLIVPHVLRLVGGPDHRFLFPASAIYGATLMVVADCVARTVVIPAELPIGILTAVFGAPVFLWLLTMLKRREELD